MTLTDKSTNEEKRTDETVRSIPESGVMGHVINKLGTFFAILFVISMVVLIQEVFLRYFFNAPTVWAHEVTIFLCATAFIYGGLYCTSNDKHIRVVIIYEYVPSSVRRYIDILISIICAFASAFFAWAAWLMVKRAIFNPSGAIHFETSGSAWDPAFPAYLKLFLFIVLIIMTLQFAVLCFNYSRSRKK